jgi:hypothetical protein
MPDPIRQAIPTPEQLQAIAAGLGRIGIAAQLAVARIVETLSAAAQPMPDPTFGRKRRARRARGRRIEARQPYSSAALAWRAVMAREAEPRRPLATFIDPSPGVQWGEITGDGSGEALPPIPDA